jgi:prohibitin 1
MVSITLRVLSRPDVDHLSRIYQQLGLDYDERVLPSIGNEVLKAIVAQFDAAELITQRELVRFPILCTNTSNDDTVRCLLEFEKTF